MTETITLEKTKEVKNNFELLKKKLNVGLTLKKNILTIDGSTINEYEASRVIEAINFGFSAKKSLSLINEEFAFEKIQIKNFTRRKSLYEVKARILGRQGKTKRTIENISDTWIILKENEVGIIGKADSIEKAITALKNIIKGSKQANVYRYLEKQNTKKEIDLGIRD